MPGINVIDSDGDIQRFPDATTWHVDDRGQLHLNSATAPVASFAKDCWQGASTDEATGPDAVRVSLQPKDLTDALGRIQVRLDRIAAAVERGSRRAAR